MYTINTLISEGETPEILDAWPRVRGFTFTNFSRASIDNEVSEE